MENKFECKFEVSQEEYLHYCDNPVAPAAKEKLKRSTTRCLAFAGTAAVLAVVCFFMFPNKLAFVFCVLACVCLLALLALRKFANKKAYKRLAAQCGGDVIEWHFGFNDENAIIYNGENQSAVSYRKISKVYSDDVLFYVLIGESNAMRIKRGSFFTGDESEFENYIRERMKAAREA